MLVKRPEIKRLADEIKKQFHPEQIILFGSYAYGTPTENSDLDLLIIMDTVLKPFKQSAIIRCALDEIFGVVSPMDIIVRTPEQIKKRTEDGDFFISKILKDGVKL